jgi:hypothetical protein
VSCEDWRKCHLCIEHEAAVSMFVFQLKFQYPTLWNIQMNTCTVPHISKTHKVFHLLFIYLLYSHFSVWPHSGLSNRINYFISYYVKSNFAKNWHPVSCMGPSLVPFIFIFLSFLLKCCCSNALDSWRRHTYGSTMCEICHVTFLYRFK